MSDFGSFGGADEEYATVRRLTAEVEANPDSFDNWEVLIKACESLEGGLNRNSSPFALSTFRDAYDRFLFQFPLLFGYWKKYADLEFNIAGPESADMVYERGVASVTNSVDLWTEYCSFKMETTHDPQVVRELFERGLSFVGLDFLAHPFWDKYIEYEERQEAHDRIYTLLTRVLRVPMHQYARYFERFRTISQNRPVNELATPDVLARVRQEIETEQGGAQRPELEVERDIRAKVDNYYYEIFSTTQTEVGKRWTYEQEIKRPYFHVTELDYVQLNNWRKYLDYEEAEGDYTRVTCLYERCLVTCALYEEFWLRYARWMSAQAGKEEEVRIIFMKAATMYVPVSRAGIRLQWAYFEESCGRVDSAIAIHESILTKIPDCTEVITSWANMERRQKGVEAAIQVYKDHIEAPTVDLYTKAALVSEWAYLLWKTKGSPQEARAVFLKNVQWYADSRTFWDRWFQFELEQPLAEQEHGERVKRVFEELQSKSRLSMASKRQLGQIYLNYLVQQGDKNSMKIFLQVDRELFGPSSIAASATSSNGSKENGAGVGELDETSRAKAEARAWTFFELYAEPVEEGQGNVDFN